MKVIGRLKKDKGNTGFTLLEVMIALAILAIALVVLLGLRNRDGELHHYSANLLQATLLAKQKLAEREISGFPEFGEFNGDFGEDFPGYSWKEVVAPTPFEAVREVQLSVQWERGLREEEVRFTTFLVNLE